MKNFVYVLAVAAVLHTFVWDSISYSQAPPSTTVFFCSNRDGDHEIYSVGADGGNVVQLTFNTSNELQAMCSPDGHRLVFVSNRDGNNEVYLMNVDGSGVVRLTDNTADDLGPSWSRDGSKIVFASERDGDSEIYAMNPDGSGLQQLTYNAALDAFPDWSPDGSKITFHSDRGGNSDIWVMNADGTNPQNLTNHPAGEYMPEWSPDGKQIVFESLRSGWLELHIMNADGGNVQRFTYLFSDCHEADWSPDGSSIVFAAAYGGNYEVLSQTIDGTILRNLTAVPGMDMSPTWQPVILAESDLGGGTGALAYCYQPLSGPTPKKIYTIKLDGTENRQLSTAAIGLNHHEWSPDGRSLALVGYVDASTWSIHTMDKYGGNLTRLTTTPGVWDSEPSWSSEGTAIAWARIYPSQGYRSEIWTMNANGTLQLSVGVEGDGVRWSPDGTHLLYHKAGVSVDLFVCDVDGSNELQLTSDPWDEMTPDISPDGSKIVYVSTRDGNHELYVMNTDGTGQRRLTNTARDEYAPAWSPDGSLIAFEAEVTAGMMDSEVFVIDSTGANLRRVTFSPPNFSAINPDWQPVDSTSVPVFITGFRCQQEGKQVVVRWSAGEDTDPGDFRVETTGGGGKRRAVPVKVTGPRSFIAVDETPAPGLAVYRLFTRGEKDNWFLLRGESINITRTVAASRILGVYPNPFNPHTTASFSVTQPQMVRIEIHDAAGRKVKTLADARYGAGDFQVHWDGRDGAGKEVASGIYFLRFMAGKRVESRKLVLVR